jgi:LuxR family maltose regulon positive regulatory protein
VTLDEGDNDPVVLWTHVIAALGLDPPAASAPLREVVLPRLVNALAERDDVVLVLDDFHRLSSPSTRSTVAWFV